MSKKKREVAETQDCNLSDLIFPVELTDNPRNTNKEFSRVVIGIINGKEKDLNYCSDIYKVMPNADIFPVIQNVLNDNNIAYTSTYRHINNVRFYAEYQITDKRFGYTMQGTNDTIMPMLTVQHSYNGQTKYKIIFGYFRLVCSNGLVIPVEDMERFNLVITGKHTLAILASFEKLNSMLKNFVINAPVIIAAITGKYEQLSTLWRIKPKKRITSILKGIKYRIVENSKHNTINDIYNRIHAEANIPHLGYKGKINDWLIYNGINSYLHDKGNAAPEIRKEIDSKVLEWMLEND